MSHPIKVVALLSAGLDSSVATWLARHTHDIVLALTFDYGQVAARREVERASRLARHMGIPHQTLALPWIRRFRGAGALLNQGTIPTPRDLNNAEQARATAKAVWVPNRNGVMIEIAAGFAEDLGADAVLVGFNREEAATFSDNSVDYLKAVTEALAFSTSNQVRVVSPTAQWDKSEIVSRAKASDFPFEFLWSCYRNGAEMCGSCESCQRLNRALGAHGISEVSFENTSN